MKTRVLRRGSVKGAYSPSSNHPFYGWHRFSGRYLCEDFAPRDEAIRPSGGRGANRPWPRAVISEFCGPRFAQGNRKQRLCGESSANRAGRRAGFFKISGPRFAQGNRKQRLCGESSANRAGRRAGFFKISGPGFAPGNREQRLCGEASANRAGRRAGCPVSMGRPLFHQQAIGYSIPLSAAPASRVPVLTASNKLYCTTIYTA